MKSMFGRHRVRATFYHITALAVVASTLTQMLGLLSINTCFYITTAVFFVDYLAEMYDPHPDNPGKWFRAHFHRLFEDDVDD